MATQWYQSHLGAAARVLLITNDRENKRKATEEGISADTGAHKLLFHLLLSLGAMVLVRFNLLFSQCFCFSYLFHCLLFLLSVLALYQIGGATLYALCLHVNHFSVSVESYVKSLGQPGLLDLLVQSASEDVGMEGVEDLRPSKRKVIYGEVVPTSILCSPTNFELAALNF